MRIFLHAESLLLILRTTGLPIRTHRRRTVLRVVPHDAQCKQDDNNVRERATIRTSKRLSAHTPLFLSPPSFTHTEKQENKRNSEIRPEEKNLKKLISGKASERTNEGTKERTNERRNERTNERSNGRSNGRGDEEKCSLSLSLSLSFPPSLPPPSLFPPSSANFSRPLIFKENAPTKNTSFFKLYTLWCISMFSFRYILDKYKPERVFPCMNHEED